MEPNYFLSVMSRAIQTVSSHFQFPLPLGLLIWNKAHAGMDLLEQHVTNTCLVIHIYYSFIIGQVYKVCFTHPCLLTHAVLFGHDVGCS